MQTNSDLHNTSIRKVNMIILSIVNGHKTMGKWLKSVQHFVGVICFALASMSSAHADNYNVPIFGPVGDPDITFFGITLGAYSQRCAPTSKCRLELEANLVGKKIRYAETALSLDSLPLWLASKSSGNLKVVLSMAEDGKILGIKFILSNLERTPEGFQRFAKMIEDQVEKKLGVTGQRVTSKKNIYGLNLKNYSVRWRKPWGSVLFMPEDDYASTPLVKGSITLYVESNELEQLWNKALENDALKNKENDANRLKM